MKKKNKKHDEEIDLIQALKFMYNLSITLWNKKTSIIIITFVSFLIGVGYEYQQSNYVKYTLTIRSSNSLEFLKLEDLFFKVKKMKELKIQNKHNINIGVDQREFSYNNLDKPISIMLLEKFNTELLDYDELIQVLKNDPIIRETLTELPLINQEKVLFGYAKSLKIEPSEDIKNQYIISFILNENMNGINILDQTFKLSINNLKKSIIDELNNRLKIKKDTEANNDLKEIEFLYEQNMIAKELNISEPKIDEIKSGGNNPLYLRGYKSIQKEIDIMKNRKYQHILNIQNDINKFKDLDIKWIDYNLHSVDTENSKNSRATKLISILIGLVAGCLFVIFSNLLRITRLS